VAGKVEICGKESHVLSGAELWNATIDNFRGDNQRIEFNQLSSS